MVCIQKQNIITRPKQRGIYISKSKIIVTWLNNMVCIKVQILYYMAKVVVLIQMQQQRNHRVSIEV